MYTYSHLFDCDFQSISYVHCKFARWLGTSSAVTSYWTIVNLTIERLLLTLYPIKAKLRLRPKVSALVSLVTVLVVQCFTVHMLSSHEYLESDLENSTDSSRCVFTTEEYRTFDQTTFRYIILIFFIFIPFAIIITGNIVIGIAMVKRKQKIHPMPNVNQLSLERKKRAVKMLLAISILNIVFTIPYSISGTVNAYSTQNHSDKEKAVDHLMQAISHLLLLCNFAFNFLLYFARGLLFREECKTIYNLIKNRFFNSHLRQEASNETRF